MISQEPFSAQYMVLPISPFPRESLAGLLARTGDMNRALGPKQILSHAGIIKGTLGSVATRHASHCDELAALIGVAPAELARRFYPTSERMGAYGTEIDIRGVRLSLRCREGKRRRVSPAALRISPYHRIQWEMRFIHWCAETYQYLIDRCGSCGGLLGWETYAGIHICERCGADLRDQEVAYVDDEYRDVAKTLSRFVGGAKGAARFKTRLHEDLRGLNEFDILKLALILASDFTSSSPQIHEALCDTNPASAPTLETWGRGLSRVFRWPEDLYQHLDREADPEAPEAGYGMLQQIGPAAHYISPISADLPKALRQAIDRFYKQHDIVALRPIGEKENWHRPGWITVSEAKAKWGLTKWAMDQALQTPAVKKMSHHGGKRSPTLIREDDLRRWSEKFKKAVDVSSAGHLIGIPEFAVWELIESGDIAVLVSEKRARTPRVGCIDTQSVMRLRDALLEKALVSAPPIDLEPLARAIQESSAAIPPWSAALQMILSNELPVWRQEQGTPPTSFISDLMIERGALSEQPAKSATRSLDFRETPRLIGFDYACQLLRVPRADLNDLLARKVIMFEGVPMGRMVERRSLYEYALSRAAGS